MLRLAAAMLLLCAGPVMGEDLRKHVVIVVNDELAASVEIGRYYAKARDISEKQICHIKTKPALAMGRGAFEHQLSKPIRRWLIDNGWMVTEKLGTGGRARTSVLRNDAWIIVLCYGVPLIIAEVPGDGAAATKKLKVNRASVDDDLALLPQGDFDIAGPRRNPYSKQNRPFNGDLARRMVLVTRLDGPSAEVVRQMIDDAIYAEKFGLNGIGYFDERGIRSGGYKKGDDWILGAHAAAEKAGFETYLDRRPKIIPATARLPEAALYFGWYTSAAYGPFLRKNFRFKRGAIAYHLYSGSAVVIRTTERYWAGPLLARGAAVTAGYVNEPYLAGTMHLDVFMRRMLGGYTFAEACYMSKGMLSWMTVCLGDPLYRPFAGEDEQFKKLAAKDDPDLRWAYVRRAYRLARSGKNNDAIRLCDANSEAHPYLHLAAARILRKCDRMKQAAGRYKRYLAAMARKKNVSAADEVFILQAKSELAEIDRKSGGGK